MTQNFNFFNEHEDYVIKLCNPNKEAICFLICGYDQELTLRFNQTSEFSMTVPYKFGQDENGNPIKFDYYDQIQAKKLIYISDIGYFIITECQVDGDGIEETKTLTAYSLEMELSFKKINLLDGTYKFYDPLNVSGTLLGKILANTN